MSSSTTQAKDGRIFEIITAVVCIEILLLVTRVC